ncbi:MAG TPA: MBL fold metallo-hydrolase [Kofleriaceae bacterium]
MRETVRPTIPTAIAAVFAVACAARPPRPHPPPPPVPQPGEHITWRRAETAADVPHEPPAAGSYRIHLIDVGTGLSILIQGADFAMLYDAGSNDKEETPARVIAYLAAALGPSGKGALCGDPPPLSLRVIDHVVLSHPHYDHTSALDVVLHCYKVDHFWDAGRTTATVFYRELLSVVSRAPRLTYHTAASVPDDHAVSVKGLTVELPTWQRFSEGDAVRLGAGARFTILHAEPKAVPNPNDNSIVLLVELGPARLLLTGDSPSGPRAEPSAPPGEVEGFLLDHHTPEIHADILQVGHHGSKTSSRHAFLAAVAPRLALVSSGPKVYGHTVLPDPEVIEELERLGARVLRTDERDADCPVHGRMGGDTGPGGCDSWIITITP